MFVDHESQGHGIGRSLLDETLAAARRMHCQKVRLSVSKSNVAAVNLYVSRGFVAVDEDEVQRRGERQSRLIMTLNLGEGLTNET
jgi:ribosomal protein S18 acetylase RimI-like enzyme